MSMSDNTSGNEGDAKPARDVTATSSFMALHNNLLF
jgi:hypothetical protein